MVISGPHIIGFAFDKLRLYNDAINDYTKALEIDNKNAFAYYNVIIPYIVARHLVRQEGRLR